MREAYVVGTHVCHADFVNPIFNHRCAFIRQTHVTESSPTQRRLTLQKQRFSRALHKRYAGPCPRHVAHSAVCGHCVLTRSQRIGAATVLGWTPRHLGMRCDAASGEMQQEIMELEEVWAGDAAHGGASVRRSPTLVRPTPSSLPGHAVEALHIQSLPSSNPSPIQRKNAWQHAEADGNNERIHMGFGRSLKRAWTSLGSSFNLSDSESIRPRAGGKLGRSLRSLSSLYSNRTDNAGLECKEQIGEGTCGIVFRALYNGRQVAVKMIKRAEQYEEQRTCPVDAKTSFARFLCCATAQNMCCYV